MSDIDFLALKTEVDIANHRDLFACVVEQMQTRAMPPAASINRVTQSDNL